MLESPAWSAMPINARRVVDRITIENMHHAGTENGRLKITYDDYESYGIKRDYIAESIAIAEALGFAKQVFRGVRGYGPGRRPAEYALTWLPIDGAPATNEWKRIATGADATDVIERARHALRAKRSARRSPTRGQGRWKGPIGARDRADEVDDNIDSVEKRPWPN